MEKPAAQDQEVDEQWREISQYSLGLSTVLRQVMKNFSSTELLKLSYVNKQWNYEARCLLRERGRVTASILPFRLRYGIADFASDLREMRVVPFCGISIPLMCPDVCEPLRVGRKHPSCNTILERLPCKTFALDIFDSWEECRNCPVLAFVLRLMEEFAQVLEDLSFSFSAEEVEPFQKAFQPSSFPRLKFLRLGAPRGECLTSFAKKLVSCAPNLKVLYIQKDARLTANVLEGSSAVLVPSNADFNPLYGQVYESLVGALRPEAIEIQRRQDENFDGDLLIWYVPKVLQAARTTLNTMVMDLFFCLPLMCYEICLDNVTELSIGVLGFELHHSSPLMLTLLATFDFTRCFPKIDHVNILYGCAPNFEREHLFPFAGRAYEMHLRGPLPDRANNIKHLTLLDEIRPSTVPFWTQMFPRVQKLSVRMSSHSYGDVLGQIWDHFKSLEELEFVICGMLLDTKNLDSVFCGIFPEEVAELREKDDEYLKALNVVPVMPSIRDMRDLTTLTLQYTPDIEEPYMFTRVANSLLTKVTALIGFARCPGLTVTIQTNSSRLEEAMGHMKAYASFTTVDNKLS